MKNMVDTHKVTNIPNPKLDCNNGMVVKFIPKTPAKKDNGIKIALKIVKVCIILFIFNEMLFIWIS